MTSRITLLSLISIVSILVMSEFLLAAVITVPPSLNPGDQYRLAFVTNSTRTATSHDIDDYNMFVSDVANTVPELVSLGTNWKAIASTISIDARVNTDTVPSTVSGGSLGVPIYLLDGTKLVDNNDDLWDGTLNIDLAISELGTIRWNSTWTGSFSDGRRHGFKELGRATPQVGHSGYDDSRWIDQGLTGDDSSYKKSFYATSGILTVIPEPSTLALAFMSLSLLGTRRRR